MERQRSSVSAKLRNKHRKRAGTPYVWLMILLALIIPATAMGVDLSTGFESDNATETFTKGRPPYTVTFLGGEAGVPDNVTLARTGARSWFVAPGDTGTILFETPAQEVRLFFRNENSSVQSRLMAFGPDNNTLATLEGTQGEWTEVRLTSDDNGTVGYITLENSGDSDGYVAIDDLSYTAFLDEDALDNPIPGEIEQGTIRIRLEYVAGGLIAPNWGTSAPGLPDYLFVSDQNGILWRIDPLAGNKIVFLDLSDRIVDLGAYGPNSYDERGLLGFAFHPDYATNGLLYTFTSEPVNGEADFSTLPTGATVDHQSVITEWRVFNATSPDSRPNLQGGRVLMRIDQPQFNNNGGGLNFGSDGMLYISLGDGGGIDDVNGQEFLGTPMVGHGESGNAQNPANVLGTILRIDPRGITSENGRYGIPADNPFVGGNQFAEEVFAYGFHNPFRFSFDRGQLYVGDIGQSQIQEIDDNVTAGNNYGWNLKEGSFFFNLNGDDGPGFVTDEDPGVEADLIDPAVEYDRDDGAAVIGGFVYRGTRIPELQGKYVFGDFAQTSNNNGRLFYLDEDTNAQNDNRSIREFRILDRNGVGMSVLGFGRDAEGEIYVLTNATGTPFGDTGVIYKIVSECEIGSGETRVNFQSTVNTERCPIFTLFLNQEPLAPDNGSLYINLEAPFEPDLVGYGFFRPSDDQVPLPGGSYIQLVKTPAGYLPEASDADYFSGELGGEDLEFAVGTQGLRGGTIVFEILSLSEGVEFNEDNLNRIQRVLVGFE